MQIFTNKNGAELCVEVKGRMDAVTASKFEAEVLELLGQGEKSVVFDLGSLDYISSAGLRSILTVAKKIESNDATLAFANLRGMVQEVFTISGLSSIFQVNNQNSGPK
jgi:anti-anti-sigma factor